MPRNENPIFRVIYVKNTSEGKNVTQQFLSFGLQFSTQAFLLGHQTFSNRPSAVQLFSPYPSHLCEVRRAKVLFEP